jgi:hypothetical protein
LIFHRWYFCDKGNSFLLCNIIINYSHEGTTFTYTTARPKDLKWVGRRNVVGNGVTGCDYDPIDITKLDGIDYGYLYSWSCAAQACPDGWILPVDADFTALESVLTAGGISVWADWNSGASLAGGGEAGLQGMFGCWWSNSSSNRFWYVNSDSTSGNFDTYYSDNSYSVRCRKSL